MLATFSRVSLGVLAALLLAVPSAHAAATPMVDLGSASTYAALSGASVGNTASAPGAPHTTLHGDLGVKADTQPTGFPPGVVTGTTRIGTPEAQQAHADVVSAYAEVAARTGGAALAGALAGATVLPGLHTIAGAVSNTTTLTLDAGGDPNAVFVFQVNGALAMAAGSKIVLARGAQASRVFWQVNGAGAVGANAEFVGTLMALDAVAIGNGTVVNGRAFARNGALTLDANEVYSAPPAVAITSGPTTTDTTPTIAGTTDVDTPVTVTVAGQTLTVVPVDGAWSVTSALLANGTYPVTATVVDGAGNTGSANQELTVDTVLPVVTIDGGATRLTNDTTPTISGTTDAAAGTLVTVRVGGQTRTALVQTDETWDVTPTSLTDGTRTVTASVSDLAGNEGTESQELTVDTIPSAMTITGGEDALTDDATPELTGTADVAVGTEVTVTLANETLTAAVTGAGTWSVVASALSDGPHRVVAAVSDAAGNRASTAQTLTVDTVSPFVAMTGGATASTTSTTPTIAGTTGAAPGTTVTVTLAGQTLTTLVQANGTWNVTPTALALGTWPVDAAVPDPAGNTGRARQLLTVTAPAGPTPGAPGAAGAAGSAGGAGSSGGGGSSGGAGVAGGTGTKGAAGSKGKTGSTKRLKVRLSKPAYSARRGKKVTLRFVLSGPAKVTLTIRRGKKVVARMRTTRTKGGSSKLTWNGRIKRRVAPKGTYRVSMRAVPARGTAATDTATVRLR